MQRRLVTYPPLDVLKPVAPGIWIVDSGPIRSYGLSLPIRMTVLRLANGDLLLHSPTRFTPALCEALEQIGPIRHLLAPSIAHWTFIAEWHRRCSGTIVWAAPGLAERRQVRRSGLRIDRTLAGEAPSAWDQELDQVLIEGGAGYHEIALFHRASRTLILTDLIVNLERAKLPLFQRPLMWAAGCLAPDGRAPIYLRLAIQLNRHAAQRAASRLLALRPERVVFAHGRWFDREGERKLRRSLRWLI